MISNDRPVKFNADTSEPSENPKTAPSAGRRYFDHFPPSENPDKNHDRDDDGSISSGSYVRTSPSLADSFAPAVGRLDYAHPIERWVRFRPFRLLLGLLARPDRSGATRLERILSSYRNPLSPLRRRVGYWLFHRLIDHFRGRTDVDTFRRHLAENRPVIRGLNVVARSLAEFGPTVPQKFSAPLFAVWNFTNRCNLACRHCYQDSKTAPADGELTLDEKLNLVDQMGSASMPMLAISGGEPTVSGDLIPVIRRAGAYGMHLSLATNGTTMTPRLADSLAEAGVRYVEISLDSADPARHDRFRGVAGMWERAVAGAKAVAAAPGLRLGIAMCVHRGNFHEVRQMISLAEQLGAGCFAHFNFIPVGRGLKMVHGDITPTQREELLGILNEKMQQGGIGVISTAPQLGRVCLAGSAGQAGKTVCSHAGSGSGLKARVVAKYLGGCGAGRTYVCIEPAGDVTPCVYLPHRVMGNIRQVSLVDIFRKSSLWDLLNDRSHRLHHCEVCAFGSFCGGCRARADAYFGQLHAGDPGCVFNDKHWEKLVNSGIAVVDQSDDEFKLTPTRHGPA